jgi:uroporphyrin-III C-methyltransferase
VSSYVGHAGKVYLVGAGPGDPKLITLKGVEAINKADVVVYDRLVSPELLKHAQTNAELIYCGKLPDRHTIPQEEINQILVDQAKLGKAVVRLKGGDPSIFGRVGEEAEHCAQHGIRFEMVPGITSGVAAPLYAGIPLTHRDLSSSVAIVTGHKRIDGQGSDIRWDKLATAVDTIVFYMGVKNLPLIQEQLLLHGRNPNTPVALVRWGTLSQQETLTGTLRDIVEKVKKANFKAPAIIVVGEVVTLREKLSWFEERPVLSVSV